jgi:uncharacterized membrane protein YgdD (TMEM256/DUF423 family)
MRIINIVSALSGACALLMLGVSHHMLAADPDVAFVYMAAAAQLSAAIAGLAIANRTGKLNLIAGALLLGGATLFAGTIYLGAFHVHALHALAPVGGAAVILGWITLAFAKSA